MGRPPKTDANGLPTSKYMKKKQAQSKGLVDSIAEKKTEQEEQRENEEDNNIFLNTEEINIEDVPIDEVVQEKKTPSPPQAPPSYVHPYFFGMEIANTIINKYMKKNISFSVEEKKELSAKLWLAFPVVKEVSPKIDLFLSIAVLYGTKLDII